MNRFRTSSRYSASAYESSSRMYVTSLYTSERMGRSRGRSSWLKRWSRPDCVARWFQYEGWEREKPETDLEDTTELVFNAPHADDGDPRPFHLRFEEESLVKRLARQDLLDQPHGVLGGRVQTVEVGLATF